MSQPPGKKPPVAIPPAIRDELLPVVSSAVAMLGKIPESARLRLPHQSRLSLDEAEAQLVGLLETLDAAAVNPRSAALT